MSLLLLYTYVLKTFQCYKICLLFLPTALLPQIVDLSLLVKQEMAAKTNPISHVISASYIHYNTHTEVHTHTQLFSVTKTMVPQLCF